MKDGSSIVIDIRRQHICSHCQVGEFCINFTRISPIFNVYSSMMFNVSFGMAGNGWCLLPSISLRERYLWNHSSTNQCLLSNNRLIKSSESRWIKESIRMNQDESIKMNQDELRNHKSPNPKINWNNPYPKGNSFSELQEDLVPARGSTVASRSEPWDTRWGVSRHDGTHVVVSE